MVRDVLTVPSLIAGEPNDSVLTQSVARIMFLLTLELNDFVSGSGYDLLKTMQSHTKQTSALRHRQFASSSSVSSYLVDSVRFAEPKPPESNRKIDGLGSIPSAHKSI
jgi:hypothetical protein